jgi:membrane protease YdiL (CAAX protease family)
MHMLISTNQHVLFKRLEMFSPVDFFSYLKHPVYLSFDRKGTNVVLTALQIYLLFILFIGLINSLNITILKTLVDIPIDNTQAIPDFLKNHLIIYFLLFGLYSPIMEEVVFRLPLLFSPTNIALSLATLSALLLHKFISGIMPIIIFLVLFLLLLKITHLYQKQLTVYWQRYFPYIFYFLSLSFGLVHTSNFSYTETLQFFIAPILVFPQISFGLILSYTRIYYRNGFLIGILIHSLLNSVSVLFYLLQLSQS